MLKEIFRTVPVPYMKIGDPGAGGWNPSGIYSGNIPPYVESMDYGFNGLHCDKFAATAGPTSIYLWANVNISWWPSWATGYWRFDGTSGKFIRRILGGSNLGTVTLGHRAAASSGKMWAIDYYGDWLQPFDLGATAKAIPGEEPKKEATYWWGGSSLGGDHSEAIHISHFEGHQSNTPPGSVAPRLYGFGVFIIDDVQDRYLDGSFTELRVYEWKSGKYLYTISFPDLIVKACWEDNTRLYILFGNQTVVLFDYVRGEILGASKIPKLSPGASYWNTTSVDMAWDRTYRRLLIIEATPNNPDGSCTQFVRGFRMMPEPVRITTPIPLRVPRQGRIIPALVQVVGGMNEGVGGYALNAEVTGSGSLVGMPVSDYRGDTFLGIACEGHSQFVPTYTDWETSGSPEDTPPHTGLVVVTAHATIYAPDPADIPTSGVSGAAGGVAGPPVDGEPGSDLPPTAPNMMHILQRIKDSRRWRLEEIYEDEPDGRGAFTGEAVTAIHDVDARFGHIEKVGLQNNYQGHAVDALTFKCDDGVTGEVYDIVSGTPDIMWMMQHRDKAARDVWKYPCP